MAAAPEHLDRRSRGVGLGGAVPLGEGGHQGFDLVQGWPP